MPVILLDSLETPVKYAGLEKMFKVLWLAGNTIDIYTIILQKNEINLKNHAFPSAICRLERERVLDTTKKC